MAIIDYTQTRKKKSWRGRKITICPHCGRKAEETRYKDGDCAYLHIIRESPGEFGMRSYHAEDECWYTHNRQRWYTNRAEA